MHAVEKWRQYLICNHFTVYTDHLNLKELFNRVKNFRAGKLHRWAVRLQEFAFTAKHIQGKNDIMADYMSRDAIKPTHNTKPTPQKSKSSDILKHYLSHLCSSSHPAYIASKHHIIYSLDVNDGYSSPSPSPTPTNTNSPRSNPNPTQTTFTSNNNSNTSPTSTMSYTYYPTQANPPRIPTTTNSHIITPRQPIPTNTHPFISTQYPTPQNVKPQYGPSKRVRFEPSNSPSLYPMEMPAWRRIAPPKPPLPQDTPPPSIPSSQSLISSTKPIPNPIFHKYPTRLNIQRQENARFQTNLKKDLIHIPDPNPSMPFDQPIKLPSPSPTTKTNHHIITNKHSFPHHNQQLLQPSTPSTPQIQDTYNIQSFINKTPISFLKYHQTNDSSLYPIIQCLKYNNNWYLNDLPQYQYSYILSGRYYLNHQDILMYKYGNINAIVAPSTIQRSILHWAQGRVLHGGAKLLLRVTQQARHWWIGIRKDIRSYLDTCDSCQRVSKGRNPPRNSGSIKTSSRTRPFELVSIDICGPLPETSKGNRYILSMIDKFSRFCMLVPIKDQRTLTVVQAYQNWLNLFGTPKHLLIF